MSAAAAPVEINYRMSLGNARSWCATVGTGFNELIAMLRGHLARQRATEVVATVR